MPDKSTCSICGAEESSIPDRCTNDHAWVPLRPTGIVIRTVVPTENVEFWVEACPDCSTKRPGFVQHDGAWVRCENEVHLIQKLRALPIPQQVAAGLCPYHDLGVLAACVCDKPLPSHS